jgi:hypothetical protein
MKLSDLFWISESRAREFGFTHHGRLYGLPAWLADAGDDAVMACPKVGVLQLVATAIDVMFDFLAGLLPADQSVDAPITFGKAITP